MTTTILLGPEMPSWIVWDELSASEEATLMRMWNASVDQWLDWAIGLLETEPPDQEFAAPWDLRYISISSGQLKELRRTPPGEERRQCLYRMLAEGPDSLSQ